MESSRYNHSMPIYEYRCLDCGHKQSVFWRTLSAINEQGLQCVRCSSSNLVRLVSRVRVIRGREPSSESESFSDDTGFDDELLREMENLDENDPRALGRFMRKMAAAANEDLGPEFEEIVGRLEKGEDPESIEQKMGDILGMPPEEAEGGFDAEAEASPAAAEPTEQTSTDGDRSRETARRTIAMGGPSTTSAPSSSGEASSSPSSSASPAA